MTKILSTIILATIIVGSGVYLWKTSQKDNSDKEIFLEEIVPTTFANDSFSVQYPNNYQVSVNDDIVTITGPKGKIMLGNFEPDASPGPMPGMTQEQIDEFPKDVNYHGYEAGIASALFYKTGDDTTMKELESIRDTIELK